MGKQPKLVKEIPKGYEFSHKDEVTGKDIYKISSSKSTPEGGHGRIRTDEKKQTVTKSANKVPNTIVPKSKTRQSSIIIPPTTNPTEDYVMLDESKPEVSPTQKVQSLRKDLTEEFPNGLESGYRSFRVPDLNTGGNYAKQKNVITDKDGMPVIYDFKQNKYIQTGEPNIHLNMPVQNDTPTIQDALKPNELPTKFDVVPERLRVPSYNKAKVTTPTVDTTIYKGFNDVGVPNNTNTDAEFQKEQEKNLAVPKLKKGGIVSKIKGYYTGGDVDENGNPYLSGNPNIQNQGQQFTNNGNAKTSDNFYSAFGADKGATSGVVGQTDVYGKAKADEAQKNKDEKDAKNSVLANKAMNTVTSGLGAFGSSYYANQQPKTEGENLRSSTLGAVSNMGAIGGVIGGIAGIGDTIGKPIKDSSEQLDEKGNVKDKDRAIRNAVVGITFSPSERLTYEGGLTDLTGEAYIKSVEKKRKEELAAIESANKIGKQEQALAARDAGDFNTKIQNTYDPITGEPIAYKKGGIVSKIQMCADGGQIKGKGTGKSDSILAKVKAGSFIVPAENAEAAEELREKFLGKPPKSKANLNEKGGETVKLSNGEHKFTPEEKEELLEKGVNVDLLAPKSEVKANDHIAFPNVIGLKEGGNVPKGTKVDGVTWNGTNWIDASGNKYTAEKGKVFENKYNQSVAKAKSNEESRKATELNVYKRKYNEAVNAGDTKNAEGLDRKIKELQGVNKVTPSEVKSESDSSVIVPKKANIKPPKSNSISQAGKFVPTLTPDNGEEVIVPNGNLSPNQIAANKVAEDKAAADAKLLNDSAIATGITPDNMGKNNNFPVQKRGILGSVDPTSLIGIGQMALGKNMLSDSKRPVDKAVLDATYNANVNRSLEDAKFGLTPEQRFAAEQDIQNSLNDAKAVGLNYSGGSGVQAFNTNRAAINDAWKAKLGLKVADTDLRMQKQKYADAMAADRASILASNRRQAYNDAMGTFQQNQSAGSELIGAGLQNTIGAYRYNKMKNQQDEINAAGNPYYGYKV